MAGRDAAATAHLDLYIEDVADAHEEAWALRAKLLNAAHDPTADEGRKVYADPAGHPFCLCWGRTSLRSCHAERRSMTS